VTVDSTVERRKGTEIGQVRGLGSAHHGAHHWMLMQLTSAASLVTCAYLVFSFLLLPDFTYPTMRGWLSGLVPPFALALLIVGVFWHAKLGLQTMIEDYVHAPAPKFAALLVLNLVVFAAAGFGLFCIARIVMMGLVDATASKAAGDAVRQAMQAMMQGAGR
jgi:succinate dehydrogenase / fumarate reductase membrane anchor subunit